MDSTYKSIIELSNISKSFNSDVVLSDFNLSLCKNKFITILGPSGSGKTTILKIIAGFETVDSGEVILNGVNISDLPPNKREINTVFQNYNLFPHMSVYDNIAFGLKMKNKDKSYIKSAVDTVLEMIKMEKFADRMPNQLSGGQQQRVAVARAIVNKPIVLLLDEPFSALDENLRKQMRAELKQLQQELEITFILVTHDQEEALSISDTVIIINNGKIEQIGSPQEIYENPVNVFVASFLGEINIIDAKIDSIDDAFVTLNIEGGHIYTVPNKVCTEGINEVKLLLRPEHVKLTKAESANSLNGLKGKITELRYRGVLLDYFITLNSEKKIIATVMNDNASFCDHFELGREVFVEWLTGKETIIL